MGLTSRKIGLFLGAAEKSVSGLFDPRQIEMWPTKERSEPLWGGVPSLLPLRRRRT